ncbi:MAG: ABC transporter ATP-binding protein, partial [Sulfuricella sp.]|nr:ABC transporter ATP-binding protein [Sulfuricella sp.]
MSAAYTWSSILGIVREHKKDLISAHIVAILAAVASVPIPLLMPLLVDEVLLHQPGRLVAWLNSQFPAAWHGPVLYISAVLALTLALRLTALILGVWQGRSFTLIAKDVVVRMREQMLLRLSRIAMSEYETLGS